MSTYDDFIIHVLNIDRSRIKEVDTRTDENGCLMIRVTLNDENPLCPVCNGKVKVHG